MTSRLLHHSLFYIVARLGAGVLGVLTTAALTRLLDPEQYGVYASALVIMTVGSSVGFEWMGLAFLRLYQGQRNNPALITTFVAFFVGLVVLYTALFGLAWLAGFVSGAQSQIVAVGLVLVVTTAWFELVSKLAIAEFKSRNYFIMSFARSGLTFFGACAGAWFGGSPTWAAAGTAAGSIFATLFGRYDFLKQTQYQFDRAIAGRIIRFGFPIAMSMTLFGLTLGGSRYLIQQLGSTAALGLYTAAAVLAQNIIGVIATGVSSAGYSMAVYALEHEGAPSARRQLTANATLLLAVLAPASLGIALTANCLATTLVGRNYSSAVSALIPWIALGSFLEAVKSHHLDHAFQLGAKSEIQTLISLVSGIVALGLCAWMIPLYGVEGAAIGLVVSAAFSCLASMALGRFAFPIPLPVNGFLRVAASCAVMAAVVIRLPDNGWAGLILRVGVGAAVYGLAAFAFNVANGRNRIWHWLHRGRPLKRPAAT